MKNLLHFLVGIVFGLVLTSAVSISAWQFWVIFLMWVFESQIDDMIDLL